MNIMEMAESVVAVDTSAAMQGSTIQTAGNVLTDRTLLIGDPEPTPEPTPDNPQEEEQSWEDTGDLGLF